MHIPDWCSENKKKRTLADYGDQRSLFLSLLANQCSAVSGIEIRKIGDDDGR